MIPDLPIASDLSYLVFKKQRSENLPPPARKATAGCSVTGGKLDALTEALGGYRPLLDEFSDAPRGARASS